MNQPEISNYDFLDNEFYSEIQNILSAARQKVYYTAKTEMVLGYWEIGRAIVEKQGGESRAEYGQGLLKELSERMTRDFGRGFTKRNLELMRQFYLAFPIANTLCTQLSWSHYRLIMRVEDPDARQFYADECEKAHWSVRQLEREINTFSYQRLLANHGNYDVIVDTAKREPDSKPEDIIVELSPAAGRTIFRRNTATFRICSTSWLSM